MARVRQKGTRAELVVASVLRSIGATYRLNVRSLPGSPDFANKGKRWAIFVHGCFWHRHSGCHKATIPKANRQFWLTKFTDNRARDARAIRALRADKFRVIVVWECEIAKDELAARLSKLLESSRVKMRDPIDHR